MPKFRSVLKSFGLYVAMTAADFASSWHNLGETNPFARRADGSFWPMHALLNCLANTFGVGVLSLGLYIVSRELDENWARFVASLPWLYYGWMHLEAAIANTEVHWGLYQVTTEEILRSIFGR